MGPFRGPYRGSPLRDPCWWAVTTEVAAHWEEVLMGPFRGGTHSTLFVHLIHLSCTDIVITCILQQSLFKTDDAFLIETGLELVGIAGPVR